MNILALDLTSEYGSLAVVHDEQVLASQELHSTEGFAHIIFGAIERVLEEAQVGLSEIDCYAAAAGPGAFTGVRVGLAAVKGLAEAEGKLGIGVSNLQAVAACGHGRLRAPILDARRGDVFAAIYDAELQVVEPETVGRLEHFLERAGGGDVEFLSQNVDWLQPQMTKPVSAAPRYLAKAVAHCARLAIERGAAGDPAALDANYVRRSDAELYWRE